MTDEPPAHLTDWQGNDWTPASEHAGRPPQRPLHRAGRRRCPAIAPEWEDPAGVPISAILFGGRRATRRAARDRGVRLAARRVPRLDHGVGDDRRRGRRGRQAAPRPVRDAAVLRLPHGRLLRALARRSARPPTPTSCRKIFYVNWFRKGADGKFLWPGYGENSRVLAWVFERVRRRAATRSTRRSAACPHRDALDTDGLDVAAGRPRRAARGRRRRLARRAPARSRSTTRSSATACPPALRDELLALEKRLSE